jgi:Na+-transporting NADH:ubiquinone oxidoreductase subunit NqrC
MLSRINQNDIKTKIIFVDFFSLLFILLFLNVLFFLKNIQAKKRQNNGKKTMLVVCLDFILFVYFFLPAAGAAAKILNLFAIR